MKRLISWVFLACAAAAILAPSGARAASEAKHAAASDAGGATIDTKQDRLPQTRYYTMKPFTLPLMEGGVVTEQFTLVISMEIADEDGRADLARRVPRIRDNMYQTLFQMVTFRRRGAPIPDVDMFKERLLKVALHVAGKELVKSILVQEAFKQPAQ